MQWPTKKKSCQGTSWVDTDKWHHQGKENDWRTDENSENTVFLWSTRVYDTCRGLWLGHWAWAYLQWVQAQRKRLIHKLWKRSPKTMQRCGNQYQLSTILGLHLNGGPSTLPFYKTFISQLAIPELWSPF